MTAITVSRVHFPVTTLGPGRRIGIWLQGCSIRCEGCISVDTWASDHGQTTVESLVAAVEPWIDDAEGITISGGEPFDQPLALDALLRALRGRTDVDVLVYSGHPFTRLQAWLERSPGLIDALMSEPYIASAPQTMALRGSDNQLLHLLTDRGRRRFGAIESAPADRKFDVMFDDDGTVWLAGIPARDDVRRFREVLRRAGHQVVLSDAPGAEVTE